jgi:hypothetical protein
MLRFGRIGVFVLAVALSTVACSGGPPPSFDPTGDCTTDGRAPGAYPDLEALVPTKYMGVGTWTFGAERAAVLAKFRTHGLTAEYLAAFYNDSARVSAKTEILGASQPMIAGRPGNRLDTQTGERLQTVVVWPSAQPDVVNVVITSDLPDARIQDAIDAFGGT